MKVLGIDAGAGTKSATGLAVLDTSDYSVITSALWPDKRSAPFLQRLRNLHTYFLRTVNNIQGELDLVSIESFVMRGKGGESLQRLIGSYLAIFEEETRIVEVSNTKIKQNIGGTGKADKDIVANGVINWFKNKNNGSAKKCVNLKKEERWDEIDAVAIAICGYLENE